MTSSGSVLKNLFKCEKKYDIVKDRREILDKLMGKVFITDHSSYVNSEDDRTDFEFKCLFTEIPNPRDPSLVSVHGRAFYIFDKFENRVKCTWTGVWSAKKGGYKMQVYSNEDEEIQFSEEFNLYGGDIDEIQFSSSITIPSPDATQLGRGASTTADAAHKGVGSKQKACMTNNSSYNKCLNNCSKQPGPQTGCNSSCYISASGACYEK
jgi:hypothetical protein